MDVYKTDSDNKIEHFFINRDRYISEMKKKQYISYETYKMMINGCKEYECLKHKVMSLKETLDELLFQMKFNTDEALQYEAECVINDIYYKKFIIDELIEQISNYSVHEHKKKK